jgi:hypothetical protein
MPVQVINWPSTGNTIVRISLGKPKEVGSLGGARNYANSVPQGATLSVDGVEAGIKKILQLALGKHSLAFTKKGFNIGTFPVEVGPDDVSGGSVSYELGTSAHDTLELRDGTVLVGDFMSASGMEIRLRVAGAIQTLDRNKVKRTILTECDPAN